MSVCAICNVNLGMLNKPGFGFGKLSDGKELCTGCMKKVSKKDPKVGTSLKKYSTEQIQELLKSVAENDQKVEEIKQKIKSLGMDDFSAFLGRKEIDRLPEIMMPGEEFENIVQGKYGDKQGVLVATDRRLIFIDVGLLYGSTVEDFPYNKITSVVYETGFITGKIVIMASGNNAVIDHITKTQVKPFADHVRSKLSEPEKATTVIHQAPVDVADQLQKLAALKQQGILSEEEFQGQKKKLLGL